MSADAIAKVGIIGAGQMGNGIAHVCALAGLPVVMLDAKPAALDKALATIGKNMDRQVSRTLITAEDRDAALGRIATGTDYALFGAAGYAAVMGKLARPAFIGQAVAPALGGVLIEHVGPAATMALLFAAAVATIVPSVLLIGSARPAAA